MTPICFVTTCMGRLNCLQQTLGTLVAQPGCSTVVVDYSCPEGTGRWVEEHYPQVQVVRVPGQQRFHVAQARNRGAAVSEAPWLCFVDADIRLPAAFAAMVRGAIQPGRYFRPRPIPHGACGTVVVARADFHRIGGYDETYRGYGGEDRDLYQSLQFVGVTEGWFPGEGLEHLPHGDCDRVRFYAEKNLAVTVKVGRVYRSLKFDVARRIGRLLPAEVRRHLYQLALQRVVPWLTDGVKEPLTLSIRLQPIDGHGSQQPQSIQYRIEHGSTGA